MQKHKSILITGGAGFIGSHLAECVLAAGHEVFCLDNLLTGSRENINHLLRDKNFKFIKGDIVDSLPVIRVDEIYNLACPASPRHYQSDPIRTIKTSTIGIINILDFALKNKSRILQASTSEIYGDPEEHPQKESYRGCVNPTGPRSCYDEGKRAAETIFFDYHRQKGLEIRVARIFNTYGPRMAEDDGRVVSNFITQSLRGNPITIHGRGRQTRSFCFVDDTVDGLVRLMENRINFSGPVNIGNPQEIAMLDLAETILRFTGSASKLIYKKLPEDDPRRRRPDITLARKKLKWRPKVSLEEGLRKTIFYFSGIV